MTALSAAGLLFHVECSSEFDDIDTPSSDKSDGHEALYFGFESCKLQLGLICLRHAVANLLSVNYWYKGASSE